MTRRRRLDEQRPVAPEEFRTMSISSSPNGLDGTFPARRHVHAWFFIGILMAIVIAGLVSLTVMAFTSASNEAAWMVVALDVTVVGVAIQRWIARRARMNAKLRSRELRCVARDADAARKRWLAAHPDRPRARNNSNSFSLRLHPGI
jgi:type IV secretory pathway TrbF-like protein